MTAPPAALMSHPDATHCVPAHQLVGYGALGLCAGHCRCGWNARPAFTSDEITDQFNRHVERGRNQ